MTVAQLVPSSPGYHRHEVPPQAAWGQSHNVPGNPNPLVAEQQEWQSFEWCSLFARPPANIAAQKHSRHPVMQGEFLNVCSRLLPFAQPVDTRCPFVGLESR